MSDKLECSNCGNDEFWVETRTMVGENDQYIDQLSCTVCRKKYKETPRPSKIKDQEQ